MYGAFSITSSFETFFPDSLILTIRISTESSELVIKYPVPVKGAVKTVSMRTRYTSLVSGKFTDGTV